MESGRLLTPPQKKILDYLQHYFLEKGHSPSYREICKAVGISSTGHLSHHLKALQQANYIHRDKNNSRTIVLLDEFGNPYLNRSMKLPVVGQIAAGQPIEKGTHEDIDVMSIIEREGAYVLRVNGDSMIGDYISHGDLVIIHPTAHPREDEIVVAEVMDGPGEEWTATLKRYRRDGNMIYLIPSNPNVETICKPAKQVRILGVVAGVFRTM